MDLPESPKKFKKEFEIPPGGFAVGKQIVDLGFPKNAVITMIKRDGKYLTPGGSTVIEPNDILVVISDSQEEFDEVNDCLYRN